MRWVPERGPPWQEEISQQEPDPISCVLFVALAMSILGTRTEDSSIEAGLCPPCPPMLIEQEQEGGEPEKESAEQLLLRWMNHYLSKAGYSKEVRNFSLDLKVRFERCFKE